jgi:hypothetical protein
MKLKISRSEKEKGLMSKNMIFCLDARVELTQQETDAVKKYHLDKQVIYNSAKSQDYLNKSAEGLGSNSFGGLIKSVASIAMARMALNISIGSLTKGHHIECNDMDEVLGAEGAIRAACEHMRMYLDTAQTFDGKETITEF